MIELGSHCSTCRMNNVPRLESKGHGFTIAWDKVFLLFCLFRLLSTQDIAQVTTWQSDCDVLTS